MTGGTPGLANWPHTRWRKNKDQSALTLLGTQQHINKCTATIQVVSAPRTCAEIDLHTSLSGHPSSKPHSSGQAGGGGEEVEYEDEGEEDDDKGEVKEEKKAMNTLRRTADHS